MTHEKSKSLLVSNFPCLGYQRGSWGGWGCCCCWCCLGCCPPRRPAHRNTFPNFKLCVVCSSRIRYIVHWDWGLKNIHFHFCNSQSLKKKKHWSRRGHLTRSGTILQVWRDIRTKDISMWGKKSFMEMLLFFPKMLLFFFFSTFFLFFVSWALCFFIYKEKKNSFRWRRRRWDTSTISKLETRNFQR